MPVALFPAYQRLVRIGLRGHGLRSRWLDDVSGRVHLYAGHGDAEGPPIVVLHGLGANATTYGGLLRRLRPHASRLWAPDLPGHGFSQSSNGLDPTDLREAVNRILTSISDEPFVLMGTSLGGGLAVRFALEHPDRVSKLVLCSPAGAPMSERELKSLLARFEMKSIADGTDYVRRIFHRPPWYHHLLGREVYLLLKSPMVQRLVGQASPEDFLTAEELGSLIPPTLLIWGQSERLLPAECLDWFKANLPSHATIIEPEGYGHSPHLEQADDLARRVIGFAGN